ncbi:TIGR04255 family protein [Actinomadura hibisca]|uniref:TIGR04255 family protein n=1 Tax=Actinomadura hibisca TaxID=68565 RepID=UPI000A02A9EF|nr:TIGR04255 family protein [Actinomadura hibisca]
MSAPRWLSPFDDHPIEEIPLAHAPLVRVLAQVRFPRLTALDDPATIRQFTSKMSEDYPLLEESKEISLIVSPGSIAQQQQEVPIWRIRSLDECWTVTIASGSLAIETSQYEGRTDFVARFNKALAVFFDIVSMPFIERLGIRYTNRIEQADLVERIKDFFEPAVMGGAAIPLPSNVTQGHALCDALFHLKGRSIQVRWGLLPARAVLDPSLAPVDRPSWIADLDSFTTERMSSAPREIELKTKELAEQAYRMFRWMVTDHFIDHFRGS